MNERSDIEFPVWRKKVDHSFLNEKVTPIGMVKKTTSEEKRQMFRTGTGRSTTQFGGGGDFTEEMDSATTKLLTSNGCTD